MSNSSTASASLASWCALPHVDFSLFFLFVCFFFIIVLFSFYHPYITIFRPFRLVASSDSSSWQALTYALYRRKFSVAQWIGVLFAMAGLGCLVASDSLSSRYASSSHSSSELGTGQCAAIERRYLFSSSCDVLLNSRPPVLRALLFFLLCSALGDGLVLAGAALYAVSNVGQEYLVKQHNRLEFLGMTGVFGSIVSAVQIVVLERQQLSQTDWQSAFRSSPPTPRPFLSSLLCILSLSVCLYEVFSSSADVHNVG